MEQGVVCFVSFTVDLRGGSTTGCHRWQHFRRHGPLPTGVCDEPSAHVPPSSLRRPLFQSPRPQVQAVMQENIEKVLQRGEKIDDLIQRSSKLSDASKSFYHRA